MAVSPGSTNIAIRREIAMGLKVAAIAATKTAGRRVTGLEIANQLLESALAEGKFELGAVPVKVDPVKLKKEVDAMMASSAVKDAQGKAAKKSAKKAPKPRAKRK